MHHSLALALHRIRDTQVSDAFATPIHFSNSPPRSRDAFCARAFAFCFAHPIEGWAERRETFGCLRDTRRARRIASKTRVNALMTQRARRLRGALRPMTRGTNRANNATISMVGCGSVPIVSQTEIDPMKTAFSLNAQGGCDLRHSDVATARLTSFSSSATSPFDIPPKQLEPRSRGAFFLQPLSLRPPRDCFVHPARSQAAVGSIQHDLLPYEDRC